ncbi:hypothetical protein ABZV29_18260 [Streptomyces sp. NPDC005236]|uniref:hypothetical protein n=1 Tax=Streptomyces sp. NPDC005236 TaxID=3157028 RepID=UPI0033A87E73
MPGRAWLILAFATAGFAVDGMRYGAYGSYWAGLAPLGLVAAAALAFTDTGVATRSPGAPRWPRRGRADGPSAQRGAGSRRPKGRP